ncbi:protein Wnt-7b isoform X4 [Nematostella vectensis]|uniref:protein Wnt-7b isoform X4 n=1 Tax=Nematostella vectensis TaxID=45351 RepID=UPI002076FCD6|nr:protein Wnt-7b isoform X4 [Nematostella vectensis]
MRNRQPTWLSPGLSETLLRFTVVLLLCSATCQDSMQGGNKSRAPAPTESVDSVAIPPSIICTRIQPLSAKQMRFCEDKPGTMVSISQGYDLGVEECKYQFRNKRWNCSLLGEERPFGQRAVPGTKEAAFTHAIISAGIVQAVTLACTQNPTGCGCDRNKDGISREGWKWGGCSVNIGHGLAVAKEFLNANDAVRSDIALMNRHNNEVGREVIRNNLDLSCKCHGPSGSCNTKTCWKSVPSFRMVGEKLRALYESRQATVKVVAAMKKSKGGQVPAYIVVKGTNKVVKPNSSANLVYLDNSPSYCNKIKSLKVPGTVGRVCSRTPESAEDVSCEVMCCGRGYSVREQIKEWKCHCKFHWCCRVECAKCSKKLMVHTCQ